MFAHVCLIDKNVKLILQLLMCIFHVFVCGCRSLAVSVSTTHAGRAVIIVALVTTSSPGWQEPSSLDISVKVRKTNYMLKLHSDPQVTATVHPQHNYSFQESLIKLSSCGIVLLVM